MCLMVIYTTPGGGGGGVVFLHSFWEGTRGNCHMDVRDGSCDHKIGLHFHGIESLPGNDC